MNERFKGLAEDSVQRAIRTLNGDHRFRRTNISKPDVLLDKSEALAAQGVRSCRFELWEKPLFIEAYRQAVIDILDPACTLEAEFGRFDIPRIGVNPKSKQELQERDKILIDCDPNFADIHERGEDLFESMKLVGEFISKEDFEKQAMALYERLKAQHPQLFDKKTGQPLTPIHPVIVNSFKMSKAEMKIQASNGGKQSHIYRRELKKMIDYFKKLLRFDSSIKFADNLPEVSFRTPAKIAKDKLRRRGVFLFMPQVYHGYSLEEAEKHCDNKLGDDFEVCDPLTGMFAVIQNSIDYLKDPNQLYKLGFHHMHGSEGNFVLQISDIDVLMDTVESKTSARNLTSGVIYNPKNSK